MASKNANNNEGLTAKTTIKSIQDRYKKLQDTFDRRDGKDRVMSGAGGEITEVDEVLGAIAEAKEGI